MDGVQILNIHTYKDLTLGGFCGIMMLLAVAYIVLIGSLYMMYRTGSRSDMVGCVVLFVIISALGVWGVNELWKECHTVYTDYYVTIDDTVSLNEFMDRYEIQRQDGKIFVVREREIEDE